MTALTRNKPRAYSGAALGGQPLAAATLVYEGACMGIDASTGRARSLLAGDVFAGFVHAQADSRGVLTGQDPVTVQLVTGGQVELAVSGTTATSVGASVFATDEDTFALAGTSLVGHVARVISSGLVVVGFSALTAALTAAQAVALRADPLNSGETPQRVILLGDSLTMRGHRAIATANTSISGTDVTITSTALVAVGSYFRVINQADDGVNIDVPVVATTSSNFTVRFPFDVTSRISATISGAAYAQNNDTGWFNYAAGELAVAGKLVSIIRNCGDGGDTLAQIRARIATEVAPIARAGDIVVFMGGVNGAGTGSDDSLDESTAADVISELGLIFDELLALGVTVHASTITQAQAAAYWATSAATALANTLAANGYIRGRCLSEARMRCFDSWTALGAGSYASAGSVETDGIHFLVAGAQLVGAQYYDDCAADYRKATYKRWLSDADNYVDADSWNLLTNCQFTGATGSTLPTGWASITAGGGTNTYTLAARSDGMGNDLTIAKAHTSATTRAFGQDISTRVSAGDRLIFGTELEGGSATETHWFKAKIDIVVGSDTSSYQLQSNQATYANGGRGIATGTRYFLEKTSSDNSGRDGVLIPAGFTSVKFIYEIQLGASGTADVIVSRPHVYKV